MRKAAAVAAAAAAVLTMLGSLLDYATLHVVRNGAPAYHHTISAWSSEQHTLFGPVSKSVASAQAHAPLFGIPLTAGALLLLVGAVLAWGRSSWGKRSGHAGALTMLAGAGVLLGTVSAVLLDFLSRTTYRDPSAQAFVVRTAPGFWLLVVAGALAIAAAVLAVLAGRARIGARL